MMEPDIASLSTNWKAAGDYKLKPTASKQQQVHKLKFGDRR